MADQPALYGLLSKIKSLEQAFVHCIESDMEGILSQVNNLDRWPGERNNHLSKSQTSQMADASGEFL